MSDHGLHPEVRSAASQVLEDCSRLWYALEAKDAWLAVRPQRVKDAPVLQGSDDVLVDFEPLGKGWTYSYSVEMLRSSLAEGELCGQLRSLPSVLCLEDAVKTHQPELLYGVVLPSIAGQGTDIVELAIIWWREALARTTGPNIVSNATLESVLNDLDTVLTSRRVTYEVTYLLAGLELSGSIDQLELGAGWTLRRLEMEEVVSYASGEVLAHGSGTFPLLVKATLTYRKEVSIDLVATIPPKLPPFDLGADIHDESDLMVATLHLLGPCRVQVVRTTERYVPTVLPVMRGWAQRPFSTGSTSILKLGDKELRRLSDLYQRERSAGRRELFIAISRLRDADLRLNPIDSIVDSFIGIEAILNPLASTEVSFTVSLAYGLLGRPSDRSDRFMELSKLYAVRSKVVHGAVAHGIGESIKFSQHAAAARTCLRDLIQQMLLDDQYVSGEKKLDKKYWAQRLLQLGA